MSPIVEQRIGFLSNRIGEGRFLIQKMDGDFLFQDTIDQFEKIQRIPNPITLPLGV